ncbi:hypothetical protein LTS12_029608, partial [Elasticomyces elasticus]
MTSHSNIDPEGPEDVNNFLTRIRELGEKRDQEDVERTKKLEDEILQGRKERQARRAERARSLSPTKDSPMLDTARFSVSSISSRPIDPPEHLEPTTTTPTTAELETPKTPDSASRNRDSIRTGGGGFGSPRGSEYGMDTSPTRQTPTFGRRGTLSWQQRPLSREFGGRSLFSTSPTRANHLRSRSTVTSDSQGQEPSRDQNISTVAANDATPAPRQQPTDQEVDSLAPQKSAAPESSVDSI